MAGSYNHATFVGRLTRDPELRYTQGGTAVCNMAVAVDRAFPGENGPPCDFFDIVVWDMGNRKLAQLCGQYLQKGRLVLVSGQLQNRSWDDNTTGQKRYKTELRANDVQFLDSQRDQAQGGAQPAGVGAPAGNARPPVDPNIDPDDIPF